jgi:hypothetical protein
MVTIYRYVTDEVPEPIEHKVDDQGTKIRCVPWTQCCTMCWIGGVVYSHKTELIKAMIENDCGYTATFLCSIWEGQYGNGIRVTLKELGWKLISTVIGPDTLQAHGRTMEIWQYSMVENGTYRKMKEKFGPLLTPKPVEAAVFATAINAAPMPVVGGW